MGVERLDGGPGGCRGIGSMPEPVNDHDAPDIPLTVNDPGVAVAALAGERPAGAGDG